MNYDLSTVSVVASGWLGFLRIRLLLLSTSVLYRKLFPKKLYVYIFQVSFRHKLLSYIHLFISKGLKFSYVYIYTYISIYLLKYHIIHLLSQLFSFIIFYTRDILFSINYSLTSLIHKKKKKIINFNGGDQAISLVRVNFIV